MILLFAFVIASLGIGYFLSREADIKEGFLQLAFSIAAGFLISTFLTLIISWSIGELSTISILAAIILMCIFLFATKKRHNFQIGRFEFGIDVVLALFLFLLIAYLHFSFVLQTHLDGSISSPEATFVDYPFHMGIISSFAYGSNFPPHYPNFAKAPLTYPFIADFLSAVFIVAGTGMKESIILGNLLFFFALIIAAISLARKVLKSKIAAAFVIVLFLLNGNFGIFYAIHDAMAAEDVGKFIANPPVAYSHVYQNGIHFMNILTHVFIAERSGLMGFAVALLYYLIFFEIFRTKISRASDENPSRKIIVAGLLLGLLLMAYAHAFLAACIISFLAVLPSLINRPRETLYKWLPLVMIALVLVLPQLVWTSQVLKKGFIDYQFGWMSMNANSSFAELASFWIKNIWVVLILAIYGAIRFPKIRYWYLPFVGIFIIANFFRFQPQDWDTIKILIHWYFASCVIAAAVLAEFFKRSPAFKVLAISVLILATASTYLNLIWYAHHEPTLFENDQLEVAEWIRSNTPQKSVFLTSDAHNHLVPSLSGRPIVLGFGGQIWTQGIKTEDYDITPDDVKRMFSTGSCELALKLGVDYVFLSPKEMENGAIIHNFDMDPNFEQVYDRMIDGSRYRIYKKNCPKFTQ